MGRSKSWIRITWSIRTLLLLTAAISMVIAWQVPRWRRQNAIRTLEKIGAGLDRSNGEINELKLPDLNLGFLGALPTSGEEAWKEPGRVVPLIGEVHTLESIWIVPGDLRSINLSPWLRLRRLRSITIDHAELSKANFEVIAALPSLESLSLSDVTYQGDALEPLTRCQRLRRLSLWAFSFVPVDVKNDSREARSDPFILDDAMMHIVGKIGSVEELSLHSRTFASKGLEALRGMESLKRLDLGSTNVDDSAIDVLLTIPNLEHVDLRDTHVTQAGIARLVQQSKIESLAIDNEITEAISGDLNESQRARLDPF